MQSTWSSTWRRERTFWQSLWSASPLLTVLCALTVLVIGASTYLAMWASAQLIGSLAGSHADVHLWLVLAVGALIVQPTAVNVLVLSSTAHQAAVTRDQHRRIAAVANGPHGIAHLEDPEQSGRIAGLLNSLRGMYGLSCVVEVWRSLYIRASGVAGLLILMRWSVLASAILLALQLLAGWGFNGYLKQLTRDLQDNASEQGRRAEYFRGLLMDRSVGKEVRLFGLTDQLLRWHEQIWRTAQVGIEARRNKAVRPAFAVGAALVVGTSAVAAWLALDAWRGVVSVVVLVAALQALGAMAAFGPLGDTSAQAARARTFAATLAEIEADLPDRFVEDEAPLDGSDATAISLRAVSFTYPAREHPVFQGLSLDIPAGQSVAIVGVNGVGKSTLIKLLAGLYPPSQGQVRIDRADPFTDEAARRRVAVIFQDFVRYHLPLRDNVLLGAPGGSDDATLQALNSAAAQDVLDRVESLDTVLDPGYDGGTDLSGGQWQRVALARAFAAVAAGAGVLVLDEPTAALDVRVEAQIFERFLESTRGMTTILVSHRLSSVRHADRIVVLGPHGIVEDGSHDELLDAAGEYSALFKLQASRFNHEEVAS